MKGPFPEHRYASKCCTANTNDTTSDNTNATNADNTTDGHAARAKCNDNHNKLCKAMIGLLTMVYTHICIFGEIQNFVLVFSHILNIQLLLHCFL